MAILSVTIYIYFEYKSTQKFASNKKMTYLCTHKT
jgi:hypothetical protein